MMASLIRRLLSMSEVCPRLLLVLSSVSTLR